MVVVNVFAFAWLQRRILLMVDGCFFTFYIFTQNLSMYSLTDVLSSL